MGHHVHYSCQAPGLKLSFHQVLCPRFTLEDTPLAQDTHLAVLRGPFEFPLHPRYHANGLGYLMHVR